MGEEVSLDVILCLSMYGHARCTRYDKGLSGRRELQKHEARKIISVSIEGEENPSIR